VLSITRGWIVGLVVLFMESKIKNDNADFALPESKYAKETEIPKHKEDTNIFPRPKSLSLFQKNLFGWLFLLHLWFLYWFWFF